MIKKFSFFAICLIFLTSSEFFSQIKIRELPNSHFTYFNSYLNDYSDKRELIYLSKNWTVTEENNSEKKVSVSVPSSFSGAEELIYQYEFRFSEAQIYTNNVYLHCNGLGHSAEFSLNDNLIFKTESGEVPFTVIIPEDLLYPNDPNKLIIKVTGKLDKRTTIPLKSSFLFSQMTSGLFRDVYLELKPKNGFDEINVRTEPLAGSESYKLFVKYNIASQNESADRTNIKIDLFINTNPNAPAFSFSSNELQKQSGEISFDISSPATWSPESPVFYNAKVYLVKNDESVDNINQKIAFYNIEKTDNKFLLNGNPFEMKGVNYNLSYLDKSSLLGYNTIKTHLGQIKSLGFNTVRFAKTIPDPIAVDLCLELGLFSLVEIPLNSMPDEFANDDFFKQIADEYVLKVTNFYKNYPSVLAIGAGSGYLSDSPIQTNFISALGKLIKDKSDKFSYASFIGIPDNQIDNLDLIGVEIYSTISDGITDKISSISSSLGNKNLFISDALYPAFKGSTNGYANVNSFEAQAKFFESTIELSKSKNIAGFFLGSMFDYKGEYSSLYAGSDKKFLYQLGILDKHGKANRIAYKIIASKLNNSEKVIIPLGTYKEESPLLFIVASLLLSIALAILINSKRKFREDATRALLRPYNFFADIRDNRILTGFHSITLVFILGATHALLFTVLLFFFRSNFLFEKILLAIGGECTLNTVSTLAWNPVQTFFELYVAAMVLFVIMSLIGKFGSFFVKNRVTFSSIFVVTVWSFLPVVLLLPLELVLYKVLTANIINPYIYAFLGLFALWLFQRLLKGLYVIYDVPGIKVYFYGILIIIFALGAYVLFQQYSSSAIYYVINAYKQYQLM